MAEPTLQEVFGANASQDEFTITISKSDLASVGLIAAIDNSAESNFAAIVAKAQEHLTITNQESNVDQSTVIEDGLPSLITRNDFTYRQMPKNINFEKIDTQTNFDPNDY